ncbi:MAG: hypothetical protein JO326_09930 [Acetobacteraceae bacterium]|nr:hypothetical protein [Acetobacteraceae bacterium]
MLFDSGTLVQRNGVELTRALADILIPDSVQAVIAARIDALPPPTRQTLQIASVIGRDLAVALLAAVADVPPVTLERQLVQLVDGEFLYEVEVAGGRGLTFKHVLIQAVAYSAMVARRRRALHVRVLGALESLHADRLDEIADRLGEHAEKGEQHEKAAHYLAVAGRRANAMGAHHTAVMLLDRSLAALAAMPTSTHTAVQGIDARLALRVALGGARVDLPLLIRRLDEAEALARDLGDAKRSTQIAISQCNVCVLLGELDRALALGTTGLRSAVALDDPLLRTSARFALAQAHTFRGALADAVRVLEDGLPDLAHPGARINTGTSGTPVVLYRSCLAIAHALGGSFEHAHAHGDAAIAVASETGRRYDTSYSSFAKGTALFLQGHIERASEHLTEAHRVCQEAEIAILQPSVARFFGLAEAHSGRGAQARRLLHDAASHAASVGAHVFDAWCRASLAEVLLMDGDPAAAVTAADGALRDARRLRLLPVEAHALRVLAQAAARTGAASPQAIQDMLETAIRIARECGMQPEATAARDALAQHLAGHGTDAEAATTGRAWTEPIGRC